MSQKLNDVPANLLCYLFISPKLHHLLIRDEVSEKLEYIPARIVVNRYVRPQYGRTCCQRVVSGDMPAHIIPKGVAEPSLIAQVVISKHCDHRRSTRRSSLTNGAP